MRLGWLSFVLCMFCALTTVCAASTGVIDQPGRASFSACYLTPENPSVCNYAILYKGLSVQIIGGSASTRYKVRVPVGDSKVVIADGWAGRSDPEGVGWVSPRFVQVQQTTPPAGNDSTVTVQPNNTGNDSGLLNNDPGSVDSGDSGNWFTAMTDYLFSRNGVTMLGVGTTEGESEDGTLSQGEQAVGHSGMAGTGIYYVFAGMGEDQEYFFALAQNARPAGESNKIWNYVRRDLRETGGRCLGVTVIKVNSARDMYNVLKDGMIPRAGLSPVPTGNQRLPIHAYGDLVPSAHNILGFATVSHSGQDGPLYAYGNNKGNQFSYSILERDFMVHQMTGGRTRDYVASRVVPNARFTFCGCNIGHCQYYDGINPSFGHGVAAVYQNRNVKVRAKWSVGSPNASPSQFAEFGKNDAGDVTRLSPEKKQYKMLINVPTNRYDRFGVPFGSEAEKQAILAYYAERDINTSVSGNQVFVRSPSWLRGKWMNYETDKDNMLESMLVAMASRSNMPSEVTAETFMAWFERNKNTPQAMEASTMAPRLQELINDPIMQARVEVVKRDNGGRLDLNDFRLWHHIYFGNLTQEQQRENRWSLPLRACTCNDHELTEHFDSQH